MFLFANVHFLPCFISGEGLSNKTWFDIIFYVLFIYINKDQGKSIIIAGVDEGAPYAY